MARSPFLKTLSALALAAMVLALAPSAEAQPKSLSELTQGLRALAQMSPAEILSRLQAGHGRVNQAIKLRRDRERSFTVARDARDVAAATVAGLKSSNVQGEALENALRTALGLDREAARARSKLADAEAQVAKAGAQLLALYDAVLRLKRREVIELNEADPRRKKAHAAYRQLAARRDRVRAALAPVLARAAGQGGAAANLEIEPDDDVSVLLEKADLARDLEERFLRRAKAIQKRIRELEEQADLARSVNDLSRDESLFDESSRRLLVSGEALAAPGERRAPGGAAGGRADEELNAIAAPPAVVEVVNPDAPPAPPAPPADPAPESNEVPNFGAELGQDVVTVDDADNARTDDVAPVNDVADAAPERGVGEQIFIGASDADINALIASGRVSLKQLKALQKRALESARSAKAKSDALRNEVKKRVNR